MKYKDKLKSRLYIGISYIVFGILMIVGGFITKPNNDFVSSFGFALIIIGIVRVRNYLMITKNEESIRKQEIIEKDERNITIMNKAKSATFSIYLFISCIAVIILSFINMHEIARWFALPVFLLIVIYWICYFIYQRKI